MEGYCELLKEFCKYGGNKGYNYGYWSGMAGYCYKIKKWIHAMDKCPKINSQNQPIDSVNKQ
jgi:hypothetical protein